MITFFSSPKAFDGHYDVIQTNAINSWLLLEPKPEIILLGNDHGTSEACRKWGLKHIRNVDCNEYGTPLVSSMFQLAEREASFDSMCYINADIILLQDFIDAVTLVSGMKSRYLLVGKRWDIEMPEPLSFQDHWESRLCKYIKMVGKLHGATGKDFFVFRKGFCKQLPPFAVGRPAWDDWFVYYALKEKMSVIDLTEAVTVIHQNHDYSHVVSGTNERWKGIEADTNLALAGSSLFSEHGRTISDANYRLVGGKLFRQPKVCFFYRAAWRFLSKYYMMLKRNVLQRISLQK